MQVWVVVLPEIAVDSVWFERESAIARADELHSQGRVPVDVKLMSVLGAEGQGIEPWRA